MADEKKKVFKLDNSVPTDKEPAVPSIIDGDVPKIHVSLFLKAHGVKQWERGGKVAYARHHNREYGTEAEFKDLFTKY